MDIGMVVCSIVVLVMGGIIIYTDYKKNKKREAMPKPVRTKILDTSSDGTQANGVGRAVVGGLVAGSLGAVVGATTAGHKNKGFTIFKVWYSDGSTQIEKVFHKDYKYREYLELLEE